MNDNFPLTTLPLSESLLKLATETEADCMLNRLTVQLMSDAQMLRTHLTARLDHSDFDAVPFFKNPKPKAAKSSQDRTAQVSAGL